jgi:general secretion pathway protein G
MRSVIHSVQNPQSRAPRKAGFTLIEIMAVVVIMGMLMTVLAVGVGAQIEKARFRAAKVQIGRIEQALDFYQLDNARYPTADQGLNALAEMPSSPPVPKNYTPGGYLKRELLLDPWDEPLQYRIPGTHNPHAFDLWSTGPDGQEGGDDVANWSTNEDL